MKMKVILLLFFSIVVLSEPSAPGTPVQVNVLNLHHKEIVNFAFTELKKSYPGCNLEQKSIVNFSELVGFTGISYTFDVLFVTIDSTNYEQGACTSTTGVRCTMSVIEFLPIHEKKVQNGTTCVDIVKAPNREEKVLTFALDELKKKYPGCTLTLKSVINFRFYQQEDGKDGFVYKFSLLFSKNESTSSSEQGACTRSDEVSCSMSVIELPWKNVLEAQNETSCSE